MKYSLWFKSVFLYFSKCWRNKSCLSYPYVQPALNVGDHPVYYPLLSNFKPCKVLCLEHLLSGQDVFAVFPTGYGKSILFQVLPDLFPQKVPGKYNIVLVICPLNSIIEDLIFFVFQGELNLVLNSKIWLLSNVFSFQ